MERCRTQSISLEKAGSHLGSGCVSIRPRTASPKRGGETALVCVPDKARATLEPRWRFKVFLSKAWNYGKHVLCLGNSTTARAGRIARLLARMQLQPRQAEVLTTTPWADSASPLSKLAESVARQSMELHQSIEKLCDKHETLKRPALMHNCMLRFGCTGACPACTLFRINEPVKTIESRHSTCHARSCDVFKAGGSSRVQRRTSQAIALMAETSWRPPGEEMSQGRMFQTKGSDTAPTPANVTTHKRTGTGDIHVHD